MISVAVIGLNKTTGKIKFLIRKKTVLLLKLLRLTNVGIEIYLVGDDFMRKNVLAFPAPKDFPRPDMPVNFLGEIYLNPDYIRKHSENLSYLLAHSFLHLLGYDHKRKNDRIKMEKKEEQLSDFNLQKFKQIAKGKS